VSKSSIKAKRRVAQPGEMPEAPSKKEKQENINDFMALCDRLLAKGLHGKSSEYFFS
jgi:hypothetical protein